MAPGVSSPAWRRADPKRAPPQPSGTGRDLPTRWHPENNPAGRLVACAAIVTDGVVHRGPPRPKAEARSPLRRRLSNGTRQIPPGPPRGARSWKDLAPLGDGVDV